VLHQPLAIVEDPDVRQAVTDFTPNVVEIRRLSLLLAQSRAGGALAEGIRSEIEEQVSDMQLRADRLDITIDDLFRLINDALRDQRAIDSHKPAGDFLRALVAENERAYAEEAQLHRERTALDRRIRAATDARLAADRACAGYVAGWAVGGRPA
jgi:hypothetical protein